MKSVFLALLCLTLSLSPPQAQAQVDSHAIQPFQSPAGFGLLSGHLYDQTGHYQYYGAMSSQANWHFTQWGAPEDFAPLSRGTGGNSGEWSSVAPWAAVHIYRQDSQYVETIMQNGGNAPCLTPQGRSSEFDLYVEPNGNVAAAANAVNPRYGSNKNFPSLAQLSSLTVAGVFTVNASAPSGGVRACRVNHAGAGYGLILVDNKVIPHEIFGYGLQFFGVCVDEPGGNADFRSCTRGIMRPAAWWYWTGNVPPHREISVRSSGTISVIHFAIGDILSSFHKNAIPMNRPTTISIDVLPRLIQLITSGNYGIDRNLRDWTLGGITFGQSLWGDTLMSTTWRGFVPEWSLRSDAKANP